MAKFFTVSATAKGLVFTDDKNKSESKGFEFHKPVDLMTAIRAVRAEFKGRESVAQGTIAMMVKLLDNPRLDAYKGKCDCNEALPKEYKSAVRALEEEFVRGLIVPELIAKGAKEGDAEAQLQALLGDMKAGGSYAQAKGKIIAWYAYAGELPCFYQDGKADTEKQLTVAAVEKLLVNWKMQHKVESDTSFAARLVSLADELDKRTTDDSGKSNIQLTGDTFGLPSAIAALKGMLATFEGLQREADEARTQLGANDDVIKGTEKAIGNAKKNKGQISPKSTAAMEVAKV